MQTPDEMNFQENDTISAIRSMVRDFAAQEMEQNILDWDESQHFPRDLFRKMGDLGLMGMLTVDLDVALPDAEDSAVADDMTVVKHMALVEDVAETKLDTDIGSEALAQHRSCRC